MITQHQVTPLLLEACPSFRPVWEEHLDAHGEELLYAVLGHFAHHLLDLFQTGKTEAFPGVAQVIEQLHVEGDPYVREAATIGLLEGIKNVWGNNNVDPEAFFPSLLPESARWWKELNAFWRGARMKRSGDVGIAGLIGIARRVRRRETEGYSNSDRLIASAAATS